MDVRANQRLCYQQAMLPFACMVAVSPHVISAVRQILVVLWQFANLISFTNYNLSLEVKKMRKYLVFGILFFALCGIAVSATQAQQRAIIAGWNILGVDPIPDDRIGRIAGVIRTINPDLIVLTEVNDNEVPRKIVEALGSNYQPPVILRQNAEVVQNIAFVFKTGVSVTDAQLIEGTDLAEESRSRKALTAKVRIGQFDFVLIGVHLKSSRDNTSRRQRSRQATAIANFISQATAGNEKDVLVIGDYNMIPRSGNMANDEVNFFAMSSNNFLRFVSSDSLLGQTSHIQRCSPSLRGNLLDGYAISRQHTRREYVAGSTRLIPFAELQTNCAAFLRDVSDHFPVVSQFRVNRDDD